MGEGWAEGSLSYSFQGCITVAQVVEDVCYFCKHVVK